MFALLILEGRFYMPMLELTCCCKMFSGGRWLVTLSLLLWTRLLMLSVTSGLSN